MKEWIVMYRLEDGIEGEVIVTGANRICAWDAFEDIAKENNWRVVAADCCLLTYQYEKEKL